MIEVLYGRDQNRLQHPQKSRPLFQTFAIQNIFAFPVKVAILVSIVVTYVETASVYLSTTKGEVPVKSHQIPVNLTPEDAERVTQLAKSERRTQSDMLRIILEDVCDGKIEVTPEPKVRASRKTTSTRCSDKLRQKLESLKQKTGMSIDKVIHAALTQLQKHPLPPK